MSPKSEIGNVGNVVSGVTQQFLKNAENHHNNYYNIKFTETLINGALSKLDLKEKELVILDIGSGSGPTVLTLRNLLGSSKIIATDISPGLLAILRKALINANVIDNVYLAVLDLNKPWFKRNSLDLVVGKAILHHLFDPARLIEEVFSALKENGAMVFFEPFEIGRVYTSIVLRLILSEDERRGSLDDRTKIFLRQYIKKSELLGCFPKDTETYKNHDDKWTFTFDYFHNIAAKLGAKLEIYNIANPSLQLTNQIKTLFKLGVGKEYGDAPKWIRDLVSDLENSMSEMCKKQIISSAGIIIRK
ncbi:class I SAM-dependent methyltransferase [Methylocystis sp. WRRC1]|uniref:class I SAM-dependent methyltransferase n=1 Tax=Methylocystis sp. WRRC1 TaxID=1732014 RepID=UPI001D13E143|nr:class I SAM-dependent methyltransferase [Methylocystis sp. WRRC1]MCC3244633.1 class I SAM-dependent methyltransferase [Methylocystis sp. WRRC1]